MKYKNVFYSLDLSPITEDDRLHVVVCEILNKKKNEVNIPKRWNVFSTEEAALSALRKIKEIL